MPYSNRISFVNCQLFFNGLYVIKYLKLNHKPGNNTDGQRKFRCEKITTVIALRSSTANYFLMDYNYKRIEIKTAGIKKINIICKSRWVDVGEY